MARAKKKQTSDGPAAPAGAKDATPARRRRRWPRRLLITAAVLFVLYTLFGFFGVPLLVRHVGLPRLNKQIDGEATLARVRSNPFTFDLVLESFEVHDAGGERVVAFEQFDGNLQLWASLFRDGYRFKDAVLTSPFVAAVIRDDGRFNLDALCWPDGHRPDMSGLVVLPELPRVIVGELAVAGADLAFRDERPDEPFEKRIEDLSFDVGYVDTAPEHQNAYALAASTGRGASLAWEGDFHVDPLTSKGTIVIEGVPLSQFMPYVKPFTGGEITAGTLRVQIDYDVAPARAGAERRAELRIVSAELAELAIEQDGAAVLEMERMVVSDAVIDAVEHTIAIDAITTSGTSVSIDRMTGGEVPLLTLIDSSIFDVVSADGGAGAPAGDVDLAAVQFPIRRLILGIKDLIDRARDPWTLVVERVQADGYSAELHDAAMRAPVGITIAEVGLEAGPIRSADDYRVPFTLSANVGDAGRLRAEGALEPFTGALEVAVETTTVDLAPIAPYLPQELSDRLPPIDLASAQASLNGALIATTADEALDASWEGEIRLDAVRFDGADDGTAVGAVEALALNGKVQARIAGAGLEQIAWEGTTRIDAFALHAPVNLASAQVSLDGTLTASTADETVDASWNGKVRLDAVLFDGASEVAAVGAVDGLTLNGKAEAQVAGSLVQQLTWDGTTQVEALALDAPVAGVERASVGTLEHEGGLTFVPGGDTPRVTLGGKAELASVAVDAPGVLDADVTIGQITVTGLDFANAEKRVAADELIIRKPDLTAALPLVPLDEPETGSPDVDAATPPTALADLIPYYVRIGRLSIEDGSIQVKDEVASPPAVVALKDLSVDAQPVVTAGGTPIALVLAAALEGGGRVAINGTVDPFPAKPSADVTFVLEGVPAQPYDPMVAPHLGYRVDAGRVAVNLPFTVQEGQLEGELDFELDGVTLGEKVESPHATDVPVKLGLSLLSDANDHVHETVPVSGDVTSPDFTVSGLIFKALLGLIGKAATAPFEMLAGAFGAEEGQDLSQVVFEPGSAEVPTGQAAALDVLARALNERPALSITAVGHSSVAVDEPAIRQAILRDELLEEIRRASPLIESLTDEGYRAQLARTYRSRFPAEDGTEVPFAQMEQTLLDGIEVPPSRLAELAQQRVDAVANVLVNQNGVGAERVETVVPDGAAADAEAPAVTFELR